MGLMSDVSGVFDFLLAVHDSLPLVVRYLVYVSFGGVVYIAVLRGLSR